MPKRRAAAACAPSSPAPAAPPICRACSPPRPSCRCSACRCRRKYLRGEDSLLSIVQMPKGMPVATFAIGEAGAANAALFAIAMLAASDEALAAQLEAFRARQTAGGARHDAAGMTAPYHPGPANPSGVARHLAGRDGRRPARPHVRARGAGAWATRSRCSSRRPTARPAMRPTIYLSRRLLDDPGLAELAQRSARGHDRVRERAGRQPGAAGAAPFVAPSAACVSRSRRTAWPRNASSPAARQSGVLPAPHEVIDRRGDIAAIDDALLPGILKTVRMGYDGKGQVRVATPRRGARRLRRHEAACPACWKRCCRWPTKSRCWPRAAPTARRWSTRSPKTCIATASCLPPPCPARMSPELRRAGPGGGAGDRRAARLCRRAVRRVLRARRRLAGGQRDGAAAAQQRPLHDRRLRHQPVRAAGAGDGAAAAGRRAPAFARP